MPQWMSNVLRRITPVGPVVIRALARWFPKAVSPIPDLDEFTETDVEQAPAAAVDARPKRRLSVPRESNDGTSAVWHFKTTILDRLDEYFGCIARVRRHDPDAYDLFSRVGLSVPADAFINPDGALGLALPIDRPTFGGMLLGGVTEVEQDADRCHPSFVYFTKTKRPQHVQAWQGDVYRVAMIWDDRDKARNWTARLVAPLEYYVGVDAGGQTCLLKQATLDPTHFTVGKGKQRYSVQLPRTVWRRPLVDCFGPQHNGQDTMEWAAGMFRMAFCTHVSALSRVVVRVRKGGIVAAFGVELSRAKRFFADRERLLATDGRQKRIFHSVVEHDRRLISDRTVRVRPHFRGLRTFEWNGYGIHIVFPGIEAAMKFDRPVVESEEAVPEAGYYNSEQAGAVFAGVLET